MRLTPAPTRRGGGRCPGPCNLCDRTADRSRPAQPVAGTGAGRPPIPDFGSELLAYAAGACPGGAFGGRGTAPRRVEFLPRVAGLPVAVYSGGRARREVWRRDQGCCTYVAPHSGRRCGSRYRLEIDHIKPFALGGATELSNGQAPLPCPPQAAPCSHRQCAD